MLVRASVRWPNGRTQGFEKLPANHRVELKEGAEEFRVTPFAATPVAYEHASEPHTIEPLPLSVETWLIHSARSLFFAGSRWRHASATIVSRGIVSLLHFWATAAPDCANQLRLLQKYQAEYASQQSPRPMLYLMIPRIRPRFAPLPPNKGFLCPSFWQLRRLPASTTSSIATCSTVAEILRFPPRSSCESRRHDRQGLSGDDRSCASHGRRAVSSRYSRCFSPESAAHERHSLSRRVPAQRSHLWRSDVPTRLPGRSRAEFQQVILAKP